jgi:hypothetical protein
VIVAQLHKNKAGPVPSFNKYQLLFNECAMSTTSPFNKTVYKKKQQTSLKLQVQSTVSKQPKSKEKCQSQNSKKQPPMNTETCHSFQHRNSGKPASPLTAMWVAQHLAEDKPERTIGILSLWKNGKRQAEVTIETINEINELSDTKAVEALNELRNPKQHMRSVGGNQMNMPINIQTLDDGRLFHITALLDSGCTGSCIDKKFIKEKGINTKKTARPIPVYNADGTMNKGGSITEYVEL